MSRKSTIIEMRPVTNLDDPNAPKRFVPVREESANPLAGIEQASIHPAPRTTVEVRGSHVDRAWAFLIETSPIALMFGGVVWLLSGLMLHYPLLSLVSLTWFIGAMTPVFLLVFLVNRLLSPEGIEFFHAWMGWRFILREQRERQERMREEREWRRRTIERQIRGGDR